MSTPTAAPARVATPASSDAQPLQPIPDSLEINVPAVQTAAFNGITPGQSTLADVEKAWGKPKQSRRQGNTVQRQYAVEPFDQIEVGFHQDKVSSIVIRLDQTHPAKELAEKLQLNIIRPVIILGDRGEILGQVYPERGVLFSFVPSNKQGTTAMNTAAMNTAAMNTAAMNTAAMNVDQVIMEPVNAESFLLRAEDTLETKPESSLQDIRQSLRLDKNNARAHWLLGRIIAARGDFAKAADSATQAVRLKSNDVGFRLTRAQILAHGGRLNEAIQETKRAIKMSEDQPHLKARALCLAGDLLASGVAPDYRAAINYHTQAVKVASPLSKDRRPAIRRAAKEVLVEAHLGAAHDIAWGTWKRKNEAVSRWLSQANQLVDDFVENEGATEDHRFRAATRALAACVGARGGVDPTTWTDVAVRSGRQLLADCQDPRRKAQIESDLGMSLYDALQICQMREDYAAALKYGKQAVEYLTANDTENREPTDDYLLGRLYFRLGAIYAVTDENRKNAVAWFEKAVPLLRRPVPEEAMPDLGRHGETFVSMGVLYWEAGQRDKALELTETGLKLMQRAVRLGYLEEPALSAPYNNLASMHRQSGAARKATEYEEMATKLGGATRQQ